MCKREHDFVLTHWPINTKILPAFGESRRCGHKASVWFGHRGMRVQAARRAVMPGCRRLFRISALLFFAGLLLAQRADRATITGIVTDPSGNSIPNATVRIHNDGTGVDTPLTTNDSGLYVSPLLTLGTYSVTVEHAGFKSTVRSKIEVLGGQTYRVDARLELGAVTEKVEVSAASELVSTEDPDVAHTV